jgi:regulating synaptic membrane exocytosis protein 2
MMGQRSHSAAPTDSPSLHSRSRSKSPRRMGDHRSLSPPEGRIHLHGQPIPSHAYVPRFSRSATATPTGSPKKRQLPQIPHALQKALKERVTQVFFILHFLTVVECSLGTGCFTFLSKRHCGFQNKPYILYQFITNNCM